jgi:hypothetical protein
MKHCLIYLLAAAMMVIVGCGGSEKDRAAHGVNHSSEGLLQNQATELYEYVGPFQISMGNMSTNTEETAYLEVLPQRQSTPGLQAEETPPPTGRELIPIQYQGISLTTTGVLDIADLLAQAIARSDDPTVTARLTTLLSELAASGSIFPTSVTPKRILIEKRAPWMEHQPEGLPNPALIWGDGKKLIVSMKLFMDILDAGGGTKVAVSTSKLEPLQYIHADTHEPPRVELNWGSSFEYSFIGFFTQTGGEYRRKKSDGSEEGVMLRIYFGDPPPPPDSREDTL